MINNRSYNNRDNNTSDDDKGLLAMMKCFDGVSML